MNILCVAATEFEIAPFLKERPAADFLITGVGTPMAIYHIGKRLQQIDYDLVIQAGIAGSFPGKAELGEVVFVEKDVFADLGISEQQEFFTLFDKGFADKNEFPFSEGWLKNPSLLMNIFPIKKCAGVTVNTVTDNVKQSEQLVTKFKADVESMEGSALHYTCLQEKTPFLQLRSISNYVGERDKTKWKMKEAIDNLNACLLKITEHLLAETF